MTMELFDSEGISSICNCVCSVIGEFWLEFDELGDIWSFWIHCFESLHFHIHVECMISLVLAVLDAEFLRLGLSCENLVINAVKMTLSEQQGRQRCLHDLVSSIHWVSSP